MYKTVIEEVKGQYKIEVQARDQIKRSLLREKKSEGVSRIKADSKERLNTSILTNLKDSLEKWDIWKDVEQNIFNSNKLTDYF